MYKIFFILFLLTSINCVAQNDYQLIAKVSGNMPEFEYIIDIHRNSQNTKICFSEYTGKEKFSKADKEKIEELRNKKDRKASDIKELMNLYDNSKIFTKECFNYSVNHPIIKISDSIIQSKEDIISEIKRNKNRVVLDAIQVEVTIKNKNGVDYSYHIHAPDNENYELFRRLIYEISEEFSIE
ncbi:hypothetical protein C8P64_0776 [Christiangramia gaetbulicola]|uniref:Uncharacterized protein n=1 Tax=Christiangramia gaetbulicola TaxID=703340 RepID=A0A2T6ALU3_9FLAO|nr:hypothetical protein [Christiangramia gaetbulicola]PTX44794.1 hypothetical protein C8P64_0776 [Christiangramia gaetbulicola]